MNYPFWDVDIGYGWLMAIIAVVHVYVSHFAIGGGLYLVLTEIWARRSGDSARLEFLQKLSKFFVMVTVVFGALTGVGIWFIIGLLNPAATEVLIHQFVWGWATEWTFFLIEITAAILYLYGWKTMSPRNHMILGWAYFAAAWLSLAIINGILSFMLTPGDWLQTGNVWDGFFNPTYWSSTIFRTGICIMVAGVFSLLVAAWMKTDKVKAVLVRYNAAWAVVGLAVMIPSYYWFFETIPESIRTAVSAMMPTVTARISEGWWIGTILAALVIVFGLAIPRAYHGVIGVVVLILGLAWFGEFEWMREAMRKPYVIYGYMYGNAVEVSKIGDYQSGGMLPAIEYRTGDDGADLFRHACRSCHTVDGYKALAPRFAGTDEEFVAGMVAGTGVMRGNMPPFAGTRDEAAMIAAHLYPQLDHRKTSEIYGLSGVDLGRKVYDIRCASCHEIGGYNDKSETLVGLAREDYEDLLDMAADLGEEMPPFTASEEDRTALIDYLLTLKKGGM